MCRRLFPGAGFELTGAVSEDPVRLLAEAFRRRKLPVQVKVLINDAPGVMAAGRYMNATTMIGVILGTGAAHADPAAQCQMVVRQLVFHARFRMFWADAATHGMHNVACTKCSIA